MAGRSDKQPLKILHLDTEKNWGGGEAQVFGLLSYLTEQGHRCHLLAHPDGKLYRESVGRGWVTYPLLVRNDVDLRRVPALRRLILKEKYDIVHFHTKRAHALLLWLPRAGNEPQYVVTRRMDYPETRGWYTRCLYNQRVDGVVAISHAIADLLVEAGVKSEKIRVIHSGVDSERFSSARSLSLPRAACRRLVVGTLAVLEERKGHRFLLQAAALLKQRGYSLAYYFGGDGSLRRQLENQASALGLGEDVMFLGFVSDTPHFLETIDIFVLPSLYEGLGVAVLEAMAAGKPVVASRVGGLTELVVNSQTGFLEAPRDVEGLAKAIARLAGDKGLRAVMAREAVNRVEQYFTLRQMARKNEAFYYDLL